MSIAKIPDQIKTGDCIYKQCAQIMDISENVLFSTLAQINKKDVQEANSKPQTRSKKLLRWLKMKQPSNPKVDRSDMNWKAR